LHYVLEGERTFKDIPDGSLDNKKHLFIIKEKNDDAKCPGVDKLDAIDDLCEIIARWYELLRLAYNDDLADRNAANKGFDTYDHLFREMHRNDKLKAEIVSISTKKYGISSDSLTQLKEFKKDQNMRVHKAYWDPESRHFEHKNQIKHAMSQLKVAELNNIDLESAIEKCIKYVYK